MSLTKYPLEYKFSSDRSVKIVDETIISNHKTTTFTYQHPQNGSSASTVSIDWGLSNYHKLTLTSGGVWIELPTTNVEVGRYELLIKKTNDADFAEFKDPSGFYVSRYILWPYDSIQWVLGEAEQMVLVTFRWTGVKYWAIQTPWFS